MTNNQMWNHLNRMQKACMASDSIITRGEFFSESFEERRAFYNWMRSQVNEFTAGPYCAGDERDTTMLYGGYSI